MILGFLFSLADSRGFYLFVALGAKNALTHSGGAYGYKGIQADLKH